MRLIFLFTALLTLSVFSFLRASKDFKAQRAVDTDSTYRAIESDSVFRAVYSERAYTDKSQPSGGHFSQFALPSSVEHIDGKTKTHPSKKHQPALRRNFNHQVETK
jgi:hypothetical protein